MSEADVPVLAVRDLVKHFPVESGFLGRRKVHAVDGVTFSVGRGETLALVGESGSGKTTIGRCVLRLIEPSAGEILFRGRNVLDLTPRQFRAVRPQIQMVFQDYEASLNPRHTIRRTLREPLERLCGSRGPAVEQEVKAALAEVEMKATDLEKHPHQLSGGQQQRIGIARAIVSRPSLVVLDEPLSSVDVSVRAQLADLFLSLQERHRLSYLFISHDLGMVKYLAHQVSVLYLGQIVERCATPELFRHPRHPYTQALLESILLPDPEKADVGAVVGGEIPSAIDPPPGCRFYGRCRIAVDRCRAPVELREVRTGHWVACCRVEAERTVSP